MEPELNVADLNSVLMYCAYLEGRYYLPHRTLQSFNHFVDAMIFGGCVLNPATELEVENKRIHDKYHMYYYERKYEEGLLPYALAYLEYCREGHRV
jgi:hypothetical protein